MKDFLERCELVRRCNVLGRKCRLETGPYVTFDGKRMREEDAEHIVDNLERMANRRPVEIHTQRVLRTWSNPTSAPKESKKITDADIAFASRIVGGDREKGVALAIQFAKGKLKSVRKAYAAQFAAEA